MEFDPYPGGVFLARVMGGVGTVRWWRAVPGLAALVAIPVTVGYLGAHYAPPPGDRWALLIVANVCSEAGFAFAALLLAREPGQRRTAAILGGATLCQLFNASQAPMPDPMEFVSALVGPLFWFFIGWVLLRYPYDRVQRRGERALLGGALAWLGPGHAASAVTLDPDWMPHRWAPDTWWLTLSHSQATYHTGRVVLVSVDAAMALWYLSVVSRRVHRLSGADRWVLAPMVASIVASAVPLLLRPSAVITQNQHLERWLSLAMPATTLLIPLAFIAVLVRQRLARLIRQNAELQEALREQLAQVRASRRRIAEAGLEERRRLERDLHDGVQQRLLALNLRLTDLRAQGTDPGRIVDLTRAELHAALAELRELARGIHPTVLSQSGVSAALDDVIDRLPLPVRLRVPARRWPPAVESTVYFVVCEALSNVVKHAAASEAAIEVVPGPAEHLVVTVTDNGRGGARLGAGSGIAGIADRVRALGGELDLASPAGGGTRLAVRLPCG